MRRTTGLLTLSALITLSLAACGDDSKPAATPDTAGSKDLALKADTGAPQEAGVAVEAGTTKDSSVAAADFPAAGQWSCKQVGECQKPCGINITCLNACKDNGCQSAKDATDKLWNCVLGKCVADCMSGFNATCDACMLKNCATEYNACQGHTC